MDGIAIRRWGEGVALARRRCPDDPAGRRDLCLITRFRRLCAPAGSGRSPRHQCDGHAVARQIRGPRRCRRRRRAAGRGHRAHARPRGPRPCRQAGGRRPSGRGRRLGQLPHDRRADGVRRDRGRQQSRDGRRRARRRAGAAPARRGDAEAGDPGDSYRGARRDRLRRADRTCGRHRDPRPVQPGNRRNGRALRALAGRRRRHRWCTATRSWRQ
jgi:hypothetical protein